jgi:hypothetical protein
MRRVSRSVGRRGWVAFATFSIFACSGPPPPAPSAVITASPTSVCLGDAESTNITLDGSQSTPGLTLVYQKPDPGEAPLQFQWTFSGSAYAINTGDDHSAKLAVLMMADRPLHVHLHVTNGEGGQADALTTISVTPLDPNGNCPVAGQ